MCPSNKFVALLLRPALLLSLLTLGACAIQPGRTQSSDPWVGYNRGMYKVNDAIDRATFKPVAKGYQKITPKWLRTGISNFFTNLGTPWVMVNELLQGKPKLMAQDTCRLVLNTVVGLGGFIDVAGKLDMEKHDEDFGQTLATWGVPSGPYVVLPLVGPSTVRDGFGRVPDYFARPQRYADIDWKTSTAVTAVDVTQTRESLLDLDATLQQTFDPYAFVRDAWMQRREYLIYDGNPPAESLEDEFKDDLDSDAADSSAATPDADTDGDQAAKKE
jgi:phospholipid-binding lipoprotein MlaA